MTSLEGWEIMLFKEIIAKLDEADTLIREDMEVHGTPTGSLPSDRRKAALMEARTSVQAALTTLLASRKL